MMLFVRIKPRLAHCVRDVGAYALQKTNHQFWLILAHSLSKKFHIRCQRPAALPPCDRIDCFQSEIIQKDIQLWRRVLEFAPS
jgi:hypothetical protein